VLIVTSYCRLPVALFYPSEGPTKCYQDLPVLFVPLAQATLPVSPNLTSVFTIQILREGQVVRNSSGAEGAWWVQQYKMLSYVTIHSL